MLSLIAECTRQRMGGRFCTIMGVTAMCRSIKVLRRPDTPATAPEVSAAALQFVRKVSGFRKPSRANQDAFEAAVKEVATATERLLEVLSPKKE
jgi:hypothetical protein